MEDNWYSKGLMIGVAQKDPLKYNPSVGRLGRARMPSTSILVSSSRAPVFYFLLGCYLLYGLARFREYSGQINPALLSNGGP